MEFKLKDVREAKEVSQLSLSKMSGISRQTIIEIEDGTRKSITTDTLAKLAQALNCNVADLFIA